MSGFDSTIDQPAFCPKCQATTLWRSDAQGTYHCLRCLAMPPAAAPVSVTVSAAKPSGGGIVRGTIDLAKFVFAVLFLLSIGTCLYVCGSAASDHGTATNPK